MAIMFKYTFLLLVLLFGVSFAFGQQSDLGADAQRLEMKKLDSMAGVWEGTGWILQGKEKGTFSGTETVQRKLDGLALLVEGKFKSPEGKTIHETLAVISYDNKQNIYRFRTYLANGSTNGDQSIKILSPDIFEWGFDTPSGKIKYTIKTADGIWSEGGEFSGDGGKTWMKFFEMNLKKQK
jgi:hypothetical protein